jgi:hypothetical protein
MLDMSDSRNRYSTSISSNTGSTWLAMLLSPELAFANRVRGGHANTAPINSIGYSSSQ